jgi:phosphate transport system substrate-binding protein
MVSRSLKPDEKLMAFPIAVDGIALIVHESNPIKSMTKDQLLDVYSKKVKNWKHFGGPDLDIVTVHKASVRSTQEVFLKYLGVKNSKIKPSIIIGDNQQGIKTVKGLKGAIGYVSIGSALSSQEYGKSIRTVALSNVEPTYESVVDGSYPMMRVLNFVTYRKPTGMPHSFLKFALSGDAHAIIKKQSFVPLTTKL